MKLICIDLFSSGEICDKYALENKKIKPIVLGSGKYIINQYPLKKQTVLSGSKVFLVTSSTDFTMPDLTGWSISEVKTLCSLLGIKVSTNGYGYVNSQSIEVGTAIDQSMMLSVELA